MKIQKYGISGDWTKVYNHDLSKTSSFWGGTSGIEVMSDVGSSPSDGKYSRLGSINDFRGKFNADLHLKLVYPNEGWEIEWTQQSDIDTPYTGTSYVKGMTIIKNTLNKDTSRFVGLRRSGATSDTYLDACEGTNWWFAIGSKYLYNDTGIPGWPETVSTHVELYAKMVPDTLLTTTGVENSIMLSPSETPDNSGFIKYNDTTLLSTYDGFLLMIINNDNSIFKQGNYTDTTSVANEIATSVVGTDRMLFITNIGCCESNNALDNVMNNDLHCLHWKTYDVYDKSREHMFYSGIIHGQYGALKEILSVQTPEMLQYQYDSVENIISAGFGKYVLVAPSNNSAINSFNGTPRTSNVIASASALLTSGTTGNINIIFKQNSTVLSTETLVFNVMTDMYQDAQEYFSVPANTNNITYSIDSNVELVGLIVRWSRNSNVDVNIHMAPNGFCANNIVQNNIPVSFLNLNDYDYFYENNNPSINPSKSAGNIVTLNNNNSINDVTGYLDQTRTGSIVTGYTNNVLYYCCWVKGSANIKISSSNNVFYNPNDFSTSSNDTKIATSENTGKWELIEGFIFPEHYNQEQCLEYLKYFKENCFNTDYGTQSIISQTSGTFYFGAKVADNTQQISIGIETNDNDTLLMYSPILYKSNSMSFNSETISAVNL